MKNKHFTTVALAAAALATSCASEDIAEPQKQNQGEPKTVTLTASVNEAQTRVGMTKDGSKASFYWHNGDAISVLTSDGTNFCNAKFTTETEDGTTSATFTGKVAGTIGKYAVYPYNESHKFTGDSALTYYLPDTYNSYKPETKIFGTASDYLSNPTNMPMLGTISDDIDGDKSISFKCLGGLAVIRIDNMPVASGTLTISAYQQLYGSFGIADLSVNEAKIETPADASEYHAVTFNFTGASTGSAGVFYLPLAVGSYTNVTIKVSSNDYSFNDIEVAYGSFSISRAGVTAIPLYNNNGKLQKTPVYYTDENNHKFVDLGLSVLWAETNVGVTDSYNCYGGFYEWRSNLSSINYEWSSASLPTKDNFEELFNSNNCDLVWKYENNAYGYKITSKVSGYEGNSIFLPAAGYNENWSTQSQGTVGYYWHSSYDMSGSGGDSDSPCFYFDGSGTSFQTSGYQCSVRAVMAKQ